MDVRRERSWRMVKVLVSLGRERGIAANDCQ